MTKWIKITNGIVDTISIERPGHFETEIYQEEVSIEVPMLDDDGNHIVDENGQTVMEAVPDMEDRQRRWFVPDETFIEGPDDVFAGFVFNGSTYTAPAAPAPTSDDVNAERDRREALGCKVNMGANGIIPLEGNEKSMRNLQGLAFAASLRLGQGDTTSITTFRDALNVDHLLTPGQIVFLWSQGAAYISALYSACWALKAFDPIPANFADNSYWPAYE